jgi:AraC-like DNA-binding protein
MLLFIRGITVLNTVLSIGVFLGISLTAFLLVKQSRKSHANVFLALVVLCYTVFILPGYLYGAHLLKSIPIFANAGTLIYPLLGPLIYFYVKTSTQRFFRMKWRDLVHLIPFLLFLIIDWEMLVASGAEKYAQYEDLIIRGIYPVPIWERSAKIVIAFVYFVMSLRLVFRYQRHLSATSTSIDRSYLRWLLLFSSFLIVPLVAILIVAFTQYQLVSITAFAFSFVSFIVMVYFVALLKPSLFHRFPNRIDEESAETVAQKKYEGSNLRDSQKNAMVAKLLDYVATEKPYLEPELTLGQLAERIGIPAHYLSQVINEKMEQSFGDFINNYRVEKAKSMLTDDQYSHFTIMATAYEAGFNSKTAFYEAFKRFTGTTPSKYRKGLVDS